MSNVQFANKAWTSTAPAFLLASILVSPVSLAQPRIVHELHAPGHFQGRVQRVVVDRSGIPWFATTRSLYRVSSHGTANDIESVGGPDTWIAMMPGGDLYARMTAEVSGRFGVQLLDLNNPGRVIANLGASSLPRGFTTLHVGYRGGVIVTATPLQNLEGLKGILQYAFWSVSGSLLGSVNLEGPRTGVVDESGEAILLLGQSDAIAFSSDGTELWRAAGSFRKGALAGRGSVALLNPADAIESIHVVRPGAVTIVNLPGPVHELTLTPDGSLAAIATNAGKVSFLTTSTCTVTSCPIHSMPALLDSTYYISAIRFLDRATVAVGVIEASGSPPNASYGKGDVFVATTDGQVTFRESIRLTPPASWSPLLDVKFGERVFSAYTHDTVFVVKVN